MDKKSSIYKRILTLQSEIEEVRFTSSTAVEAIIRLRTLIKESDKYLIDLQKQKIILIKKFNKLKGTINGNKQ